jgi:hypothetical protein
MISKKYKITRVEKEPALFTYHFSRNRIDSDWNLFVYKCI